MRYLAADKSQASPSAQEMILVLLNFLAQRGRHRVSESELHRLVFDLQATFPIGMTFVQRPVIYSNQLFDCLRNLERGRLVDELVYVHDGWVPKHLYELTRGGRFRAAEVEERIRTFGTFSLDSFFRAIDLTDGKALSTSPS